MRVDPLISDYPVRVRAVAVCVVVGVSTMFYLFPRALGEAEKIEYFIKEKMTMIPPPETEQIELPEPPARPSIPIATEEEFADEDYDEFDSRHEILGDLPPPPEPGGDDSEFVAYDKAPTTKAGKGINPEYPKLAIEMKLEGKVYIKFFVDKRGRVDRSKIIMQKGNPVFEKAAIDAVANSEWKPAMQRDMKVGVWMTVPVTFRLKDSQ